MKAFPFYKQFDSMDCGATCLRMVASYYGKRLSRETLRNISSTHNDGVSLLGLSDAAEKIGLRAVGMKIGFDELMKEARLPCILHWNQNHFIVLTPQARWNKRKDIITIADPAEDATRSISKTDFKDHWVNDVIDGKETGTALLLEPTSAFFNHPQEKQKPLGFKWIGRYLWMYKKLLLQLFAGLLAASVLQLIFPLLTQSIVDTGIATRNMSFITIVLIAQLMLFFSRTVIEFIRSRVLLYISTRLNLNILSDFWIKLMKLPISFFDTRRTGDIMQRLGDHQRIETFLTKTVLSTLFSVVNLFIFSAILLLYNSTIFFIFIISAILYYGWIKIFLKFRRKLDYKSFALQSSASSETLQLIQGMQEIKLNNSEQLKRWNWERLQADIFKLSFTKLSVSQYQQAGTVFINEGKNIFITFLVAQMVVNGQITLGAMLAIQYIIGQLNAPVEQLVGFMQSAQDARISLERLNEIHELKDEECQSSGNAAGEYQRQLPDNRSICLKDVSFTYAGAGNSPVLHNICLKIPAGKTTAIVGTSGSGKTTLLKLLLKFYDQYPGEITVGDADLRHISPWFWRSQCGAVMQDGYIFNDSIAKNIAMSDETPDPARLIQAAKVANIHSFIQSLPLGFNTKIGMEGMGISSGQRQRILIARVVYKNPEYIFFDEATNALDADNEKRVLNNLQDFFKGKTAVIIAHRLSTVKNAENIIVLRNGWICEEGTHEQLIKRKMIYYNLVKNQLELGT